MIRARRLINDSGRSILLLLFFAAVAHTLSAQKKSHSPQKAASTKHDGVTSPQDAPLFADTSPIRRAIHDRQLRINGRLNALYGDRAATDTVDDLTPFLQAKQSCDFEKAVDSNGCIIVRYNDGFAKKVCKGVVTEVITADGKRHVRSPANRAVYMYVTPIPPPPNPSNSDTAFQWLVSYNRNLMDEIAALCADDKNIISRFTANEQAKCNGSLYKEIEYRTLFIEEFLKAR